MKTRETPGSTPRLGLTALVIIFILESAGSFLLARNLLNSGYPRFGTPALVYATLLAVVPIAFLVILIVRLRRILMNVRLRVYGSRLQAKLVRQFLLVAAMASIPHGVFLGALLKTAVSSPWSVQTRAALDAGFRVAVAFQEERISRLAFLAERDALSLGERARWDADVLLSALSERDRDVAAVEIFRNGASVDFAGKKEVRLWNVSSSSPGPLSRIGAGGTTYLRHLAHVSSSKDMDVAVSLRLPREIDEAAEALGKARFTVDRPGPTPRYFAFILLFFWFVFAMPPLLISIIVGLSAADTIVRPIASLEDAARHAASGDLSPRLLPRPGDELGGLVSAWNRMLAGVEASRYEAAAAEKVAAWRDIAQRLAHELKNPLTPIRLSAERVLRRWKSDPESIGELVEPSMLAIIQETDTMNTLLTDFRSFARLPAPFPDWTNLKSLLEESSSPYIASFPEVAFDLSGVDSDIILRIDRSRMRQALENLISNALDAMAGTGVLSFRSDLVKAAESRYCRLQIRDTGRGIPEDVRDRIFAPYFTTKPAGTGLGLAITERIIQDHGGRIRFESEPGSGTVFYLDLPIDA